jgi:hypothetical protein
VTLTHPHHPFAGQRVDVIRIRRGPDPDLMVRLPDSTHMAMAMSWSDDATAPPRARPVRTIPLLDPDGRRQVVQLLDRLRAERRGPPVGSSS